MLRTLYAWLCGVDQARLHRISVVHAILSRHRKPRLNFLCASSSLSTTRIMNYLATYDPRLIKVRVPVLVSVRPASVVVSCIGSLSIIQVLYLASEHNARLVSNVDNGVTEDIEEGQMVISYSIGCFILPFVSVSF